MFAVEFSVSEVAAGGERLLTHGALQTLFVPRGLVDAHQEAVGYGPLATLTHRLLMAVRACERNTMSYFKNAIKMQIGVNKVY